MQFVEPADISPTNFKIEWQKAENEITYETNIVQKENRYQYVYIGLSRTSFISTKR